MMKTINNRFMGYFLIAMFGLFMAPWAVYAQDHGEGGHGGGGGGGGGCGDVFGDLIHILRDSTTGQPILAQRWVELPAEIKGYGWGYCPIAVYHDEDGVQWEIPFAPLSCDMDPGYLDQVEEVDYFGRLNGGRTKERNNRMHFNEVISNIKQASVVRLEETGRIEMGFGCEGVGKSAKKCTEWATIDSPMESMALYVRVMKYGHIATDPFEEDEWAHGDPALPTQYHPALGPEDWPKFTNSVRNLLPGEPNNPNEDDASDCNYNTEGDFLCAGPEELSDSDFVSGATYLAAAANKTGKITVDLIQYVNRFLKITQKTQVSEATLLTLPARYRDCWLNPDPPFDEGEEPISDPDYVEPGDCKVFDAVEGVTPNYDDFPDIQEKFVDFGGLDEYERNFENVSVILNDTETSWLLSERVSLTGWVELLHGEDHAVANIAGFKAAANDVLRSIEYVHNYDPPVNLYCTYGTSVCNQPPME